jgi:hypothetical protein
MVAWLALSFCTIGMNGLACYHASWNKMKFVALLEVKAEWNPVHLLRPIKEATVPQYQLKEGPERLYQYLMIFFTRRGHCLYHFTFQWSNLACIKIIGD